jgi:hypothetical protein
VATAGLVGALMARQAVLLGRTLAHPMPVSSRGDAALPAAARLPAEHPEQCAGP